MCGNGGFGNGLFGGGGFGNNGAGFLASQINGNNGRDLLMQAITSNGEANRSAVQNLATALGQDFNLVNSGVQALTAAVNQIANAQGVNALQIVNAVQAGNASIVSQIAQCCCNNQLAIANQTNALQTGINGVQQSIAAKSAADQLSMCQQTYTLTDAMNRNYLALDNKIDALESSRKDRELAAANAKIAALESQNYTAGVVQQAVAPILGQLNAIGNEVEAIKRCQPATITLPNNAYVAVPSLYANFGTDFAASYLANRFYGNQTTTPTTTPATPA